MPFERYPSFPLSSSATIHFLGPDFLEKCCAVTSFSQKEVTILEFDSNNQNSQPGELNDPLTSFIRSISDSIMAESGSTGHLPY